MESGKFSAKIHRCIVLLWFASMSMIPCRIHKVKMTVIFHTLVSSKFIYRILFKLSKGFVDFDSVKFGLLWTGALHHHA
jgi:hypothetical protein